jgi:hypothetical protein
MGHPYSNEIGDISGIINICYESDMLGIRQHGDFGKVKLGRIG